MRHHFPIAGRATSPSSAICLAIIAGAFLIPSTSFGYDNHPVRVYKNANGWPHYYEISDNGVYVKKVLMGYGALWIGETTGEYQAQIDNLANNNANFLRLWMRPSDCVDGHYPFHYDNATHKVDLDTWDSSYFDKLQSILSYAQSKKVVVELLMWDRCTGWMGAPLPAPRGDVFSGKNVHHPQNHYRSRASNEPIPDLYDGDEARITNSQWYDTTNTTWMNYQKAWMNKVMATAMNYDYITVEIENEAPDTADALRWREYVHDWFHGQYPGVITQSNGLGLDDKMRQWGRDNPGKIDMVASHGAWTYSIAERRYNNYKGMLPGCNEHSNPGHSVLDTCRKEMWGITMGGGASYMENIGNTNGATVTNEMYRFFYPSTDKPEFWAMTPRKALVTGNDGTKYVIAGDDKSEILVFMDGSAGTGSFTVNAKGTYKYRTFSANGTDSSWSSWVTDQTGWTFTNQANKGYQIVVTGGAE
jgi:hypothetical protein